MILEVKMYFYAIFLAVFLVACGNNSVGTMVAIPQLVTSDCSYPVEQLPEVQVRASDFDFGWNEIYRNSYRDDFIGCLRTERWSINIYDSRIIVVKEVNCNGKVCDMVYEGGLYEI
jgi:hypothetical protein